MSLPLSGQLDLPLRLPPPREGEPRRIVLGCTVLDYVLVRGTRRTIGLSIDQRGLRVGAPRSVPLRDIEDFIRSNAAWVSGKLRAWQRAGACSRVAVCDGSVIPVLGRGWTLRLTRADDAVRWDDPSAVLTLGASGAPREALTGALKVRALDVFRRRAEVFAALLPVAPPHIALSAAHTRWGSCNARTGVRLNWRLVHLPLELIDYVVAHELAHLREMNHSARFWALVERMTPGCRALRAELNERALRLPRF